MRHAFVLKRRIPPFGPLVLALAVLAAASVADAGTVTVKRKIEGSFLTNVAGSSVSRPPYIQVIRSRDGFDYTLSRFERLKNKTTRRRLDKLKNKLKNLDFGKNMIVAVFSEPMDNCQLTLNRITTSDAESAIEVNVSYRHKIINYRIPPKKSIRYIMAVVPKSDLPVILKASEVVSSKKKKKPEKLVTVTGRLMRMAGGNDLQLVPVVIRRGSKNSYYIKGKQAGPLQKYAGKVVTLKGRVSRERDSPYEWDLTVEEVVKVAQ